jgi:hypothetical protein
MGRRVGHDHAERDRVPRLEVDGELSLVFEVSDMIDTGHNDVRCKGGFRRPHAADTLRPRDRHARPLLGDADRSR